MARIILFLTLLRSKTDLTSLGKIKDWATGKEFVYAQV